MIASAAAVSPICPHCDRPTRSSVEIAGAIADIDFRVTCAVAGAARQGLREEDVLESERVRYAPELARLEAELQGEHLACPGARPRAGHAIDGVTAYGALPAFA